MCGHGASSSGALIRCRLRKSVADWRGWVAEKKMTATIKHKPEPSSSQDLVRTNGQGNESESQGMAIVGQVAGGILHDFNNILTVITGTIDILAQAVVDRPDLAAVARLIDEAATRGARLTSQLLAFARGRSPQPCDLDIDELLADVGRLLRPTLGTEIEITARVVPGTPTAFADPGQLMAALLCLAIMARNVMAGGGRIEFEARSVRASAAGADQIAEDGVQLVLKAHANGGAIGRPDHSRSDMRMVEDFVGRSNGRLMIGEPCGADFEVEILLPRGEALLA
jgi:nitrogen-specific signal transduction histidine kinase